MRALPCQGPCNEEEEDRVSEALMCEGTLHACICGWEERLGGFATVQAVVLNAGVEKKVCAALKLLTGQASQSTRSSTLRSTRIHI